MIPDADILNRLNDIIQMSWEAAMDGDEDAISRVLMANGRIATILGLLDE